MYNGGLLLDGWWPCAMSTKSSEDVRGTDLWQRLRQNLSSLTCGQDAILQQPQLFCLEPAMLPTEQPIASGCPREVTTAVNRIDSWLTWS